MTITKTLLAAVFTVCAFGVQAQTADEIISKNTEAMGGQAKLDQLNTVKMSGNMSVQGTDVAITITKSHMKGMRVDMEVMGMSNYQVANNEKGSIFMPVMGMTDPKEMDDATYKAFSSQFDVQGGLANYKEKGSTAEYVGKSKVDGNDVYQLKITTKSGRVVNYFIDSKTSLLVKTSGKTTLNGQETEVEQTYADYKKNADGFMFPYTTVTTNGTITIDTVETNKPVDEGIFKN